MICHVKLGSRALRERSRQCGAPGLDSRRRLVAAAIALSVLAALVGGCRDRRRDQPVNTCGSRTLHFTDMTDASHLDVYGYGMGVATGDFNNDGCIDLYVTKLGTNQLLRNNCDGTFTDVTKQSRTESPGWSVSAAFVDFDRDGWLDLFVGHYVNYSVDRNIRCFGLAGGPDYCPPHAYTAHPSKLNPT